MNERIKRFSEQAINYATSNRPLPDLKDKDLFLNNLFEKFAELIVQECSNIVFEEGCTEDNQDCPNEKLYQLSNKIEQHFGFEE